jgi:hypothetical protein
LPLLEQAIERMRALTANAKQSQTGNIIPLPGLAS